MASAHSRRSAFAAVLVTAAIITATAFAKPRPSALANITAAESGASVADSRPVERITFTVDGKQETVTGRILIEAQDGGVLLESPDGAEHTIEGKSILRARSPARRFSRLRLPSSAKSCSQNSRPASASTPRRTTSSATTPRESTPSGPARSSSDSTRRSPAIGSARAWSYTIPSSRSW